METISKQQKYYLNHRDKVLEYKKELYADKIKKYAPFKNIRIRNVLHPFSTKILKHAIDTNKLLFYDNSNVITKQTFVETYEVDIKTYMRAYILNHLGTEIIHEIDKNSIIDDCLDMLNAGNYLVIQFDNFKKN